MTNIFGEALQACCINPLTGYYRDGYCRTDNFDQGKHVVCAVMTAEFLTFSYEQGNDLITARLAYDFPGLKPGDKWCLCALRWKDAFEAGCAPLLCLEATSQRALDYLKMDDLIKYAYKKGDVSIR